MKAYIAPLALAISAVVASPIEKVAREDCHANNCLRAVRGNPGIAYPFCFSTLGRITTSTDVRTDYSTTTTTITETKTQTNYDATVTTTVVPPEAPAPELARRTAAPNTSTILKACSTDAAKISSACSCFLGTSTSTQTLTTTTTLPYVVTETVSETTTTDAGTLTVSSTCYPIASPISNGGFESGILPWYLPPVSSDATAGSWEIVEDETTPNPTHAFKATLLRQSGKPFNKVILAQSLPTCNGVTYTLSFWYKFEGNWGGSTYLVVLINGGEVLNINSAPNTWTLATTTFTAGITLTELRFDIVLGQSSGYEYVYIDGVDVTPI
ncbi:hypothetical protein ABW19_dt0200864 [Dactylella cylindrospora]|nr:hypothetical protein ABW19_dt0200864 [Dactylella cylindrospora]